jgi:small ligand-binding sensory domain FIST
MPFAAALSTASDPLRAVDEAAAQAASHLGAAADLAMVFFSPHHAADVAEIAPRLQERCGAACLILGCQGEAIVGNDREIENGPALSLWLANWPQPLQQMAFHLTLEETSEGYSLLGWPDALADAEAAASAMLVLADPFSFPVDQFLQQVNDDFPGLRVLGGMSSGAQEPGHAAMIVGSQAVNVGAVGVLLQGSVEHGLPLRSVVSQGCRPIGKPLVITKARDNLIVELGGKPALVQLQELWQELPEQDQLLVRQGLHIGRVLSEYKEGFQRGDFLVRNVVGFDRGSGAVAITDRVRVGQTVQFHVRDAGTADEDLHALLQLDVAAHDKRPAAALLFTCNGRGTRLFEQPHHDAQVLRAEAGTIPVAGFFAQGELGPVSGQNSIHGFTASVVLFEE